MEKRHSGCPPAPTKRSAHQWHQLQKLFRLVKLRRAKPSEGKGVSLVAALFPAEALEQLAASRPLP